MSVEVGQADKRAMLSPAEVADRLGLSRDAVDTMIAKGELPSVRFSERRVRVPVDLLERYIAERTIAPPALDDAPDAAARAAHHAALMKRRAAARWAGRPDDTQRIQLPEGMSVGPGGVLKWG